MNSVPSPPLREILVEAYRPCPAFGRECSAMTWRPEKGYIPRGFCGCLGSPEEVKLVLVAAEPGDPHPGESYPKTAGPEQLLERAFSHAYRCYRDGKDLFHRNVRRILDLCWPGLSFEDQMKRTWITESVLCSAAREGGNVPASVWRECRRRYLDRQLAVFDSPIVAALGSKAKARTGDIPGVCAVAAASPPGCNKRGAMESWEGLAGSVRLLAAYRSTKTAGAVTPSRPNTLWGPRCPPP